MELSEQKLREAIKNGIKTINEAKGFKNTTDFEEFLKEIDGMGEAKIRKIMGKDYIDTPGFYQDEKADYDDVEDFMRSNMGTSEFEELESWWENNVAESVVNEKVSDKVHYQNVLDALEGHENWDDSRLDPIEIFIENLPGEYDATEDQISSVLDKAMGLRYENLEDFAANAISKDLKTAAKGLSKYYKEIKENKVTEATKVVEAGTGVVVARALIKQGFSSSDSEEKLINAMVDYLKDRGESRTYISTFTSQDGDDIMDTISALQYFDTKEGKKYLKENPKGPYESKVLESVNEAEDAKKYKQFWDKGPETQIRRRFGKEYNAAIDNRVKLLLSLVDDADKAEDYAEMDFLSLPDDIATGLVNMDPKELHSILDESVVTEGISFSPSMNKRKNIPNGDIEVNLNGDKYTFVYSADAMGTEPYGIILPGKDVITMFGKDKTAKKLYSTIGSQLRKWRKDNYSNLTESVVVESVIGIKTEKDFKPKTLVDALDNAKIKYKINRLSMTLSVLDLDKKYFDDANKVVADLGLTVMMAKESKLNEAMISPSGAKGLRSGHKIKTQNGTYTITGFGSQTNATKDFEATNEKGKKFNLRVSLRGARGIQVAAAPSLNFPEKEEMLESIVNEDARIVLINPTHSNDFIKTVIYSGPNRDADKEVEKLNAKLSKSQKENGFYWKIITFESLGESKLNESEVGRLMILIDDGATDAEILKEFPKLNTGDLDKWYDTFIHKDLAAGMKSKDLGESNKHYNQVNRNK